MTPPKFTSPARRIGSSPSTLTIFPGTARHIRSLLSQGSRRRDYLSQRNSAVIRRDALMPVRPEAFVSQTPDGALGQIVVLKTSAGQRHSLFAPAPRDGADVFSHCVVKLRRDYSGRDSAPYVPDDAERHRPPVNNDRGLLIAFARARRIGFVRMEAVEREFQLHCALSFELRDLANAGDRRHGVENSSGARSDWRVEPLQQHLAQRVEFMRRKRSHGRELVHRERLFAEDFIKQSRRGATRLFDGLFAAGQTKCAKVSDARERIVRYAQKLSAPDRAVQPVATAVPHDAKRRGGNLILGHTGQGVREVVLDAVRRKPGSPRILRREVIRVRVTGDV